MTALSRPSTCFSIPAQAFGCPVVRWSRGWLASVVKDKNQRAAGLSAGGGEMHRRAARHDDVRASCAPDHLALRGLQTGFSRQRVPGLRAGMPMRGCRHAWGENRLHVLHRVLRRRAHRKRPDFGDTFAARRTPTADVDREEPYLTEGLNNG